MSTTSSPSLSPMQPLHGQHAQIQVPQAPLGVTNGYMNKTSAMGTKALLAKKLIRNKKTATSSPTDNLLTPCSAKLNQAKKKHFSKAKSISKPLFGEIPVKEVEVDAPATVAVEESSETQQVVESDLPTEGTPAEEEVVEDTPPAVADISAESVPLDGKKVVDENENPFA